MKDKEPEEIDVEEYLIFETINEEFNKRC